MTTRATVTTELVGCAELQELFGGLTRQHVGRIVNRPDFPRPAIQLRMGKAWSTTEVLAWIATHRPSVLLPNLMTSPA